MPNEQTLKDFLSEHPLPDDIEEMTWWDQDRDVAWDVEESYFGKLAEVYKAAGWERCYHRNGNKWHINVKVHGDYQKTRAFIDEMVTTHDITEAEAEAHFQRAWEMELESFWESLIDWDNVLSEDRLNTGLERGDYWQCGRMGGYLAVKDSFAALYAEEMILLAEYTRETVDYMNGKEDALYIFFREWIGDTVAEDKRIAAEAWRLNPRRILAEFVADIDAVGIDNVEDEWPDLVPTYTVAKEALGGG